MLKIKKIILWTVISTLIVNFNLVGGIFKLEKAEASSPTNLVINEFVSNPSSGNEWVEIYNPSSSPVDITGWRIQDGAEPAHNFGPSLSGIIPGQGFVAVESTTSILNNDGDKVVLKNASSETIDEVAYGNWAGAIIEAPAKGKSAGRYPDGINHWNLFTYPTKGESNKVPAPDGDKIVVNSNPPGTQDTILGNENASKDLLTISLYSDAGLTNLIPGGGNIKVFENGSFGPINIGDNEYSEIYLIAIDEYGNKSEIVHKVNDIQKPVALTFSSSDLDPYYKPGDQISITVKYNEPVISVTADLTVIDSGMSSEFALNQISADTYQLITPVLSEAAAIEGRDIAILFTAKDTASNPDTEGSTYKVTIDKTAPSATARPLPSAITTKTFNIDYTASDATSGVDYVQLWFSYSSDGQHYTDWVSDEQHYPSSPIPFDTENAKAIFAANGIQNAGGDGYYDFFIEATDKAGNSSAEPSEYTIEQASTLVDTSAPASPSGFSASAADGYVKLSWVPVPDAEYYEIWRASSDFVLIATLPASQTSYVDKDVTRGKTYQYKIIAIDSVGHRSEAALISIAVPRLFTIIPKVKAAPKTAPVVTAPPSPKEEVAPPVAAEEVKPPVTEKGKILGEEEKQGKARNWTPVIVIGSLIILFIAAYLGWSWYHKKTTTERW